MLNSTQEVFWLPHFCLLGLSGTGAIVGEKHNKEMPLPASERQLQIEGVEFCKVYRRKETSLAVGLIEIVLEVLLTGHEVYFSVGIFP